MQSKICNKCGKVKFISDFHKSLHTKDGLQTTCIQCRKKYSQANIEKRRIYVKKWQEKNRQKIREYDLLKRYGLTIDDYNKMYVEQQGCCKICGKHQSELKRSLFVDHSHKTGKVRMLLCQHCNIGISYLDNEEWHNKAIRAMEEVE